MRFKVNDIVEAFGCRGVVVEINHNRLYSVTANLDGNLELFITDGRHLDWHREPSLKLISRPKRMVTKTIERWVNVYDGGTTGGCQLSKLDADNIHGMIHPTSVRIACVRLVGTYEVEEES